MAMAGNLDSFFAQKDKKKKKKASCSVTTEKLAKRLELTSRQAAATKDTVGQGDDFFPAVNNNTELNSANDESEVRLSSQPANEADNDEWVEVEERQADYNNLKISKLVLDDQPKREENGEETNATSASAHAESSNPWARKAAAAETMETDAADKEEPVIQEPEESKPAEADSSKGAVKSAYVPPHLRGEKKLAPMVAKRHGASNRPPELGNINEFPDLMESTGRATYTDAEHNQIETRRPADHNAGGELSLTNRFGSLSS